MTIEPTILPRAEHGISRKQIDDKTLKVLYRLRSHGHRAYLVGGGVRDLLLGRTPKDFDVGTDATPGQVKKLFRNCFLVGRRFRLAHVRFGSEVVEVATFRRRAEADDLPEHPDDNAFFAENVFGTPEEDAFRRDFTINALFYDIDTFAILDYVGGLEDLAARRIRVIGDPVERFAEDPVRMLRALEFTARLDFTLDPEARLGIYQQAPLIADAAPARIREELMELFRHRVAGKVLREARATGLLPHLLAGYEGDEETFRLLDQIDRRTAAGTPIDEGFALAALFLTRFVKLMANQPQLTIPETIHFAGLILTPHCSYFHIASGIRHQARELLVALQRIARGPGQRGERRFLQHPGTPQAFELFRLWLAASGGDDALLARWDGLRRSSSGGESSAPVEAGPSKRRRRRRGGRKRRTPAAAD